MAIPPELKARRGDLIPPKYRALLRWARGFRRYSGSGVRLTVTPLGTWINAVSRHTWDHPWRVTVGPDRIDVGYGTVNAEVPWIGDRRLDGTDAEYIPTGEGAPFLELAPGEKKGRTFVVVQVTLDEEGETFDPANPEGLRIRHIPAADREPSMHPLAVLYWADGELVRQRAIAHHDLLHDFVPGAEEADPGNHRFRAV